MHELVWLYTIFETTRARQVHNTSQEDLCYLFAHSVFIAARITTLRHAALAYVLSQSTVHFCHTQRSRVANLRRYASSQRKEDSPRWMKYAPVHSGFTKVRTANSALTHTKPIARQQFPLYRKVHTALLMTRFCRSLQHTNKIRQQGTLTHSRVYQCTLLAYCLVTQGATKC